MNAVVAHLGRRKWDVDLIYIWQSAERLSYLFASGIGLTKLPSNLKMPLVGNEFLYRAKNVTIWVHDGIPFFTLIYYDST